MSPIKISPKMWLILVLPTAGIIALFIFLAQPKFKEIKALDAELVSARAELVSIKKTVAIKEQLVESINALQGAIDYYAQKIPSEKGMSWLLIELSRLARTAGIKYISITPQPVQKTESYIKIPIKLEIICSYHNLGRYLSYLEASQRFISVDNITITSDPSSILKQRVSLSVSTFMLSP